jgi:GTP 3',8-cyclase
MIDQFNRRITYLRWSVIDSCNLACMYCMPHARPMVTDPVDQLNIREMGRLAHVFAGLGIEKVRLTGGEPTLRRGVEAIVETVAATSGIRQVVMTTNGISFAAMARALKAAGLKRVNISLDTLNPATFQRITGADKLENVLTAIELALEVGLTPVKLNMVVMRGVNDLEVVDMLRYAICKGVSLRFIEVMPTHQSVLATKERLVPSQEVKDRISGRFELEPMASYEGSPSRDYRVVGSQTRVGFISPLSNYFCGQCNRVRLKANGELKTCLHGDGGINLRRLLREDASDMDVAQAISQAVYHRDAEHFLNNAFVPHKDFFMSQVGG